MADTNGHQCPECGAPRGADNTPSCGCTQRASDALREARTAEAAAAEDFDPLRIRPYVELEGENSAPAATDVVPVVSDATMPLRAVPAPPASVDPSPFDTEAAPLSGEKRPRRRGLLLAATAGAVVAVVAAAGFASGLFAYEPPSRDSAGPGDLRPAVPDMTTTAASASPSTAVVPSAPVSPSSASPSAAGSAGPSGSPSPSPSGASPTPSLSAEPSVTPTASSATEGPASQSDAEREAVPPALRRGSEGPEVVELELRLAQVTQPQLYTRKASGHYNEGVEDAVSRYQWARGIQPAEYGVYDLVTRERLESETTEP
ncbi:peptidoglycan-binding domain-containing protein [Streptomyces sp. SID13726]|uniref:peptidoglycan-binding domain-containing protein n=1 Tax=Streptomyces sp. SID13726 TaxID=2706058 RepID=UPI0013B6B094|nr:peptidoglycan-binding domain-containing protein [Streptomyces sp. SID13726]NEB02568.1 peptidoglycan-binding protein [Streptomyces sp. SID13726]